MNKNLFFCAAALIATAHLYAHDASSRPYKFINQRKDPVDIVLKITEGKGGRPRSDTKFRLDSNVWYNIKIKFFI